jgi:CheY-like chemotaxis protein
VGKPPDNALSAIDRAVTTGAQLTRQLLTFARRQPLQVISIRLRDALPPLLSLIQTSVGRQVQVSGNVAADVGCVEADRAELELALINLALNARDAMPDGGRLSINVTRRAAAGPVPARVAITVSDNGTGIAPELRDRVFEPFFTTKPVGQGTGLGLAQVYGFATQAGGSVQLDSEPGEGTSVTILLPESAEPAAVEPEDAPAEQMPPLSATVLLVEDNAEIAQALVPLLQQSGARVLHAAHAEAALRELEQAGGQVDVVLSDIVMPGPLNGLDLALQLQRRQPHLPIVLMTGYTAQLHKALAHGFQVLPKPCSPATLCRALAEAVRRHATDVTVSE